MSIYSSFRIYARWKLLLLFTFHSVPFVYVRAELYSLQGMEFLEGFGKKKQQPHQQANNISSVHINPLSAQSLNIHLHGIFFLFYVRFFVAHRSL